MGFLGFAEAIVTYFDKKKYPEIYLLSGRKSWQNTGYRWIHHFSFILRLKSRKLKLTAMFCHTSPVKIVSANKRQRLGLLTRERCDFF